MQNPAISLLTVCGLEELDEHSSRGVTHVLSILDPDWPVPEAFGAFGEHRKLELRFHDVIDMRFVERRQRVTQSRVTE